MHEGWINSLVQRIKPKDAFTWFSILFFLACMLLSLLLWFEKKKPETTFIQELQQCAKNTDGDMQLIACTREVVSSRLNTHRTSDLMIELATSSIPSKYSGCHGIAHIIGEETYVKYGDVEKAVNECPRECYGGCLHGVMAGAVKAEYGANDPGSDISHMDLQQIEKIGVKYCMHPGLCHGIGHILYFASNDFEKAAQACDKISRHYMHEMCVSGVFMQGIGGLHDSLVMDDSTPPLPAAPKDDYAYPCDHVSARYQHGCFLYLPGYQAVSFEKEKINDLPTRLALAKSNCEIQAEPARSSCFEGMGQYAYYYVSAKNGGYVDPVSKMCNELQTLSDRKSCVLGFVNVSREFGYNRQAYAFCPALNSAELQDFCYYANFSIFDRQATSSVENFCKDSVSRKDCGSAFSIYESHLSTFPDYRYGLYGEVR